MDVGGVLLCLVFSMGLLNSVVTVAFMIGFVVLLLGACVLWCFVFVGWLIVVLFGFE